MSERADSGRLAELAIALSLATDLGTGHIAGSTSHPSLLSVALRPSADGSGHATYAEQPDDFAHAVSVFAAVDRRAPHAPA